MTSPHQTGQMIHTLARQAGARQAEPSYAVALAAGVALSTLSAVTLALLLLGPREAGLAATLATAAFHFKIAAMVTLGFSGVLLAHPRAVPDRAA